MMETAQVKKHSVLSQSVSVDFSAVIMCRNRILDSASPLLHKAAKFKASVEMSVAYAMAMTEDFCLWDMLPCSLRDHQCIGKAMLQGGTLKSEAAHPRR